MRILIAFLISCFAMNHPALATEKSAEKDPAMNLIKITPVLLTDDVQACIDFWEDFGLSAPMTVPDENGLMFAMVTNGEIELMYQTFRSARADDANAVAGIERAMVYIEVRNFDEILDAAKKYDLVKPEHMTDYGAREIYIRDPAGNVVGFAQQGAAGK